MPAPRAASCFAKEAVRQGRPEPPPLPFRSHPSPKLRQIKGGGLQSHQASRVQEVLMGGEGVRPTLMGDRFYGSPALIAWCRDHGWGWRLRCKQDLRVF